MFTVNLYEKGDKKIVEEFIESLSEKTIAKTFWTIDLLKKYGLGLGMPYMKKVTSSFYELRIRKQESVRFLFIVRQTTIVILHGFKKKQMKIPQKELDIAHHRLTEYNV